MTFKLGESKRSKPYLFADLAELIIAVRYDNNDELSQAKLTHLSKEMAEDLDEEDFTPDISLENCWSLLDYRQTVFGEFYPFKIEKNRLIWKSKTRSEKQSLYLFLLVCSRLRSFDNKNGIHQNAAKAFTIICREALQTLAGEFAKVRIFDANSEDRQTYYGTNLKEAMIKLAKEMGAKSIDETEIEKLHHAGDYGLDLIAVHHFNDGAAGSYNIVGQCGAQEEGWLDKTLEAHPVKFKGLFTLLNEPDNLMFIPLSYRNESGEWVATHNVSGCLLIDRQRILQLLDKRWIDVSTIFQIKNTYHSLLRDICPEFP